MIFGRQSVWKQAVSKLIAAEALPEWLPRGSSPSPQATKLGAWAPAVGDCSDISQIPASTDIPDHVEFPISHSYIPGRTHSGTHPPSVLRKTWAQWFHRAGRAAALCGVSISDRASPQSPLCPKALRWPFPGQCGAVSDEGLAAWRNSFPCKLWHAVVAGPRAPLRW